MAKNYIDNLSEEARKGMQEKADQGIWPTKCPLGYRNVTGLDGKKVIATDPAVAPMIAKLFEWYARGDISLKEAARKAHAAGLAYPKSGAKVPSRRSSAWLACSASRTHSSKPSVLTRSWHCGHFCRPSSRPRRPGDAHHARQRAHPAYLSQNLDRPLPTAARFTRLARRTVTMTNMGKKRELRTHWQRVCK
jgi:hypothetical protein